LARMRFAITRSLMMVSSLAMTKVPAEGTRGIVGEAIRDRYSRP
jgi:hypothetical protein